MCVREKERECACVTDRECVFVCVRGEGARVYTAQNLTL